MQSIDLSTMYTSWPQLAALKSKWEQTSLSELFANDSNRAMRYTLSAAGIELDYSKNPIDEETLNALTQLAKEAQLDKKIKALIKGDNVNTTENRPALHTALRFESPPQNQHQEQVQATLEKVEKLVTNVYSGEWKGHNGKRITDVVNIGIGGSDLGPRMITKALTAFHTGVVKVHFVANIDGAEISDTLAHLNPESTLFIVASKSFSTLETLENSLTARQWMLENNCPTDKLAHHFVAISSKVDKAVEFGIGEDNIFPMWDWVGGRYSLWSAIGLPIAFAVGMDNFNKLRTGAARMDAHFAEAPLEKNIPVIMGLLMVWYSNVLGTQSQAILPYANHLQLLPNYLQQLEMESNGKSITKDGLKVDFNTGSIIWGTEGTNGQHSFHQLLHQGTAATPIDFIAVLKPKHSLHHQNKYLFANCVAQSQALMTGRDLATSKAEMLAQGASESEAADIAPHKVHPGNRGSNTFILEELTPESLGALIAAYEHKVFVLGAIWNINSFDQWGVELGKLLGTHVATAIETTDIPADWDSSTQQLIRRFNDANKTLG